MIAHVTFDSGASGYEINGELYSLKNAPEVQSVRLLYRKEGEAPMYCLEITFEDKALDQLKTLIETAKSRYASEVSNMNMVTYAAL